MKKYLFFFLIWFVCCAASGLEDGGWDVYGTLTSDYSREHVVVAVEGTTARFRAISTTDTTRFRVIYSTSSLMTSSTAATEAVATAAGEVLTVTVTGLTAGQTYYYQAQHRDGTGAWSAAITPADGIIRSFKMPVAAGTSFKFMCPSDSHLSFDGFYGARYQAVKPSLQEYISVAVKAVNPDFLIWGGDDVINDTICAVANAGIVLTSESDTRYYLTAGYENFFLALTDLGLPNFFVTGNHDRDSGNAFKTYCYNDSVCGVQAYCQDGAESSTLPLDYRKQYLMFPQNSGGVEGRYYSFIYGDALFIVLQPYAYSTGDPINSSGCAFSFGQAQTAWYHKQVRNFTGKWVFVFVHNQLSGPKDSKPSTGALCNDYTYAKGGVDAVHTSRSPAETWADDTCNAEELYKPLKYSTASKFLFLGHNHYYSREIWKNMYVYSMPSPTCFNHPTGTNDQTLNQYKNGIYYGFAEEGLHQYTGFADTATNFAYKFFPENHNQGRILTVEVSADTVKIYGVDSTGATVDDIPVDIYRNKTIFR